MALAMFPRSRRFERLTRTDTADFTLGAVDSSQGSFDGSAEGLQAVGRSLKDDNGNGEIWDVLLKSKIAVNGYNFVPLDFLGQSTVNALVEEDSHEALASMRVLASSRKAITCSRVTVGNPCRKSSIVSPPSKYSIRV